MPEPLYECLECGKRFYTFKSAEKALSEGCPKCGGSDIDICVRGRWLDDAPILP